MLKFSKTHPEFITGTCLEWRPLIKSETNKDIIIESLRFLTREGRAAILGFVLMNNHFHLIWQMRGNYARCDVQRDFMKYTSQKILKELRHSDSAAVENLRVRTTDRKFQVWQRNSLSITLTNEWFLLQKLNYIHNNSFFGPVCRSFLNNINIPVPASNISNERVWDFLEHYKG